MSLNQIKKIAIKYTMLLVFIMGILSTFTLLSKPKNLIFDTASLSLDRSPASIGATVNPTPGNHDNDVKVIQLDCKKNEFTVGEAMQVRLRGRTCQSNRERIENSDVRNHATGLAATVFFSNETNNFTTDLIQLRNGVNKITIDNKLAGGGVDHSEITVIARE